MRRQQILARQPPPELWVVIDEAALARVAGGQAVMRNQLEHLLSKANEPGITVQIIGFEYGLYPGGGNHFILLRMGDDLPDVLYTESLQDMTTPPTPEAAIGRQPLGHPSGGGTQPPRLCRTNSGLHRPTCRYLMPPHSIATTELPSGNA